MSDGPGVVVIKIGGAALETPGERAVLWRALTRIHASPRSRVVVVHGGGGAVDRRLAALGLTSERRQGIRITPPEHVEHVVDVLSGSTNLAVVAALRRHGANAVGLRLCDGGTAKCVKTERLGFDAGCVGEIVGGDPALLRGLLAAGYLPVLSSIALDDAGGPLNVNADDAAVGAAKILEAKEVVLLTDVRGVMDAHGDVISELDEASAGRLIDEGVIRGGMIVKVRAALAAAEMCGRPIVIASWDRPEDIEAVARGAKGGTRVLPG